MWQSIKEETNWNSFTLYSLVALAGIVTGAIGALFLLMAFSISFIQKSYYSHLLIFFFLTFFFADMVGLRSDFFDPLRYILLGLTVVLTIIHTNLMENKGWFILPFVLIALIFSLINSPLPFGASIRAVAYLLLAISIFGFFRKLFLEYPRTLSATFLSLLSIFYFVPLLLFFTPIRGWFLVAGRFSGFMGNPNGIGLLSIMCIPLVDYLVLLFNTSGGEIKPKFVTFLKAIIILSVIFAGSRNAMFSILIYEGLKVGFRSTAGIVFTVFLLFISYLFVFQIDWISIIKSLGLGDYFRVESLESGSGRTEVWEIVWNEIKKSPFIGKGIQYDIYFMEQIRNSMYGSVIPRAYYGVWNSYLSLWMDVGFFGLLAYFYFIFRLILQSAVKRLSIPFVIATLFSGIAESWMASSLNAFTPLFFLYFALQSVPLEKIESKVT